MNAQYPILIADAGGTKVDWRFIEAEKQVTQFESDGMHPYFQTMEDIQDSLKKSALAGIRKLPRKVYFYGAGCGTTERAGIVHDTLDQFFICADVEVYSDMLGSARASCGHEKGISCILGTGSNACFFNGTDIEEIAPSLGFWLGDEGSGAYLGKCTLQSYLRKELPYELSTSLEKRFKRTHQEWMRIVYEHPKPNTELASIAKWVYDQKAHPKIADLIMESFGQFLDRYVEPLVTRYNTTTLHFTGSIAFYFNSYLRKAVQERGWQTGHVLEKPIAGITLYHSTFL